MACSPGLWSLRLPVVTSTPSRPSRKAHLGALLTRHSSLVTRAFACSPRAWDGAEAQLHQPLPAACGCAAPGLPRGSRGSQVPGPLSANDDGRSEGTFESRWRNRGPESGLGLQASHSGLRAAELGREPKSAVPTTLTGPTDTAFRRDFSPVSTHWSVWEAGRLVAVWVLALLPRDLFQSRHFVWDLKDLLVTAPRYSPERAVGREGCCCSARWSSGSFALLVPRL